MKPLQSLIEGSGEKGVFVFFFTPVTLDLFFNCHFQVIY